MTSEDEDPFEEARENAAAHAEMFRERYLSAELAFWSALMSLAGIFVSAASVVVAVGDKRAWGWLAAAAFVAAITMVLLVLNFRARRSFYRFLGQPPPEDVWRSEAAFEKYVEDSRKKRREAESDQRKCESRERVVYCCLALSGVFLVIGSYCSGANF